VGCQLVGNVAVGCLVGFLNRFNNQRRIRLSIFMMTP